MNIQEEILSIAQKEHGKDVTIRWSRGVWVAEVDGEIVDEYSYLPEGEEERVRY